jgi:hypothetical protein
MERLLIGRERAEVRRLVPKLARARPGAAWAERGRLPVARGFSSDLLGLGTLAGNSAVVRLVHTSAQAVQRDETATLAPAKPKINYKKAEKANKKRAVSLGWGARLAEVRPEWAVMWDGGNFDAFADAVAAFQVETGLKGKAVDGILGGGTWSRLRPVGEVVTGESVGTLYPDSVRVCSLATEERLKKGFRRATGERLVSKEEESTFRIILHSRVALLWKVPEELRGTGAAGALFHLGKASAVLENSEIWDDRALRPGAAMQVWKLASDVDLIKEGTEPDSWGTSFVFVSYVGDDKMKVLHFNRTETMNRSSFEVWFGANPTR